MPGLAPSLQGCWRHSRQPGSKPKELTSRGANACIALTESGPSVGAGKGGPGGAGKPTLLIVDDEPFILSALGGFFHHMLPAVTVRMAKTGAEGLAILAEEDVALIISDYRMPDMDGIEFLVHCRKRRPEALRVLFTAHGDLDLESQARARADIAAFVPKGADPVLLLDAVRAALGLGPDSKGPLPQVRPA